MEHWKVIFSDKSIRRQMGILLLLLLAFFFLAQLLTAKMAENYKVSMLEHDYAAAGYLLQKGGDPNAIIKAFTIDNTGYAGEGRALLTASGYKAAIKDSLLPEAARFHRKFSGGVIIFSALLAILIIALFYYSLFQSDKRFQKAEITLRRFLDGDTSIRLEDGGEGRIFRFFSAVNAMATSLTSHIEKETQNKQFLKQTISDISHQLKTPLAALQMYNQIIINENTDNVVVDKFSLSNRRELERMETMIQNLLKIARFDAEAIELDKATYDLRSFLENVISGFLTRAELEKKTISLQCESCTLLCFDEIWLGEAVGNIIKNALDHTSENARIEIVCVDMAVTTEITVRDNGAGIHEEDIYFIFNRFYRSRFSQDKQGVGIGLALTKAIVEKHGGTIHVQSRLGNGAEFHLLFPKLTNL